ncbi:pentapeptide repeat-containing protein [Bradyrhizobium erythrophlei]|uniref:Pentapeptide repeat-containing protein n=1 Tax=Bradyrhizobium erythrophlei TaxID=1437360 RepID=A0A1M5I799_9BRAD|nr:pentapeptide repeat-containing protein [Bradyrhizobium erythrophlei]SHG23959.1 Pentapeptide repeat-containing protein [Bradyrhizobium erythrophlei]
MKISAFETEALPPDFWEQAQRFLSLKEGNFIAQVDHLGWDRSRDFRHADLAGIDFSNCDLRGFDFSGSDLRNCYGTRVKWDATTIFTRADARGSLFEYAIQKADYFDTHPEDYETVKRLAGEIWTNAILGVEELLQRNKRGGSSLKIAQAVFDETKSTVVRSDILRFMRIASESEEEHKAFIFNTFARFSDQQSIVVAGIRALAGFYRDDIVVFNWLRCFLRSDNKDSRREAFKGLIASKHFLRGIGALRDYAINSGDSLTRRMLLGRLAAIAGPRYVRAARDTDVENYLDFIRPITRRKLEDMALRTLTLQRLKGREEATSHNVTDALPPVRIQDSEISEMARDFRQYLSALKQQYKIPFVFDL